MTEFRAQGACRACPTRTCPGTTNNYSTLQEFTGGLGQGGGKVDVQLSPTLVDVRPLRMCATSPRTISRTSRCPPAAPATAHIYARNRQFVLGTTWTPSATVAARGAVRLLVDAGGKESAGARVERRIRSVRPGRPADRRTHRRRPADAAHHRLRGPWTAGDESAVAVPDGLQPEDQLHLADRRALVQERLRVPAHRHRSAGREPAVRPRHLQHVLHPPRRSGGEQSLQPRRLHARPASPVRAQQRPGRESAPQHALCLCAGRLACEQPADAEPRHPLRVTPRPIGNATTS